MIFFCGFFGPVFCFCGTATKHCIFLWDNYNTVLYNCVHCKFSMEQQLLLWYCIVGIVVSLFHAELGTRQHYRDNVTMFSGSNIVACFFIAYS